MATTTKLIFKSTISSPPTPFHQCRRGIFGFWLHLAQLCRVTSFFQCYQSHWETLITGQCQLAGSATLTIPGMRNHPSPACVSPCCSSRMESSPTLQPSPCKHALAQVTYSHPWGKITHQFFLHCNATSPRSPRCPNTAHRPSNLFGRLTEDEHPSWQAL